MKRLRRFWRAHWQLVAIVALCFTIVASLMLYKLGSLTGGLSSMELQVQHSSGNWHNIVHDPLNLPLKAVQWVLLTLFSHHGQTITRLPSALFGISSVGLFVYILRRWYGVRTAVLGGVLFAFSATLLHASRLASLGIMYIWGILALMALHIVLERTENRRTIVGLFGFMAILLYIPGMVWLVTLNCLWQWKTIREKWQMLESLRLRITTVAVFVALLALLGWSFWQAPALIRSWLGAPVHFTSPLSTVEQFVKIPWYVFVRQPADPRLWLNGLPVLDVFSSVMFGLGAYFYIRHWRAPRTQLLLSFLLAGGILFAIGGPVALGIILPIIYVVLVAGVAYLLHEWLRVFPLNPLARGVGMAILVAVIAIVCLYHVRAYFVAWPNSSQSIAVFDNRS